MFVKGFIATVFLLGSCLCQRDLKDFQRVPATVTESNDIYFTGLDTTWISRNQDCPRTIRSIKQVTLHPTTLKVNVTKRDEDTIAAVMLCQGSSNCGAQQQCREVETETKAYVGVIDTEHRDHIRRQFGKDIAFFDEDGDLNYFEIMLTYPINCVCAAKIQP